MGPEDPIELDTDHIRKDTIKSGRPSGLARRTIVVLLSAKKFEPMRSQTHCKRPRRALQLRPKYGTDLPPSHNLADQRKS